MDLTAAAEQLYAARPEEFVALRTELAAHARRDGDRELAARIAKLAKPTTAAWAVNMLVRHEADQVRQVLDLGAALRRAQVAMAGDELRELGRQRRQLIAAVTRRARHLAAEIGPTLGQAVGDQVESTLHAAMVDEDAAAAVRTGQLVRPLTATGLEPSQVAAAVAVPESLGEVTATPAPRAQPERGAGAEPEPTGRPELTVVEDEARRREEAQEALAEAEAALGEAERRLAKAERRVAKREAKALQLRAELDEARRRVAELEERIEDHEDQVGAAEEQREEREARVAAAQAEVDRARKALEAIG